MTARDDLIAAASALAKRGRTSFSPAELIVEARSHGSNYQETTLRSMIVHHLRVDADDTSGKPGFVRVGRGSYRLNNLQADGVDQAYPDSGGRPARATPMRQALSSPPPAPTEPDDDWYWEGNVQAAIVRHLAAEGWSIRRVADTESREQGIDIEAEQNQTRLLVEVKGYPSATYRRGPNQGTTKTYGAGSQARTYYGNALLSGLLMRADHPDARVALAFPDVATFRTLATRTATPLARADVEVWLVAESGDVIERPSSGL